jgi:HKD family nuclease
MHTDLTFISNEGGSTLKNRLEQLIKDCKFFDCLVGYFYISGFHQIYKALENTERIRILMGIGTSQQTYDLIKEAMVPKDVELSHHEAKQEVLGLAENEIGDSVDSRDVEEGIQKFVEWIKNGKLIVRAYPSRNLHAKLYIMAFKNILAGRKNMGEGVLLMYGPEISQLLIIHPEIYEDKEKDLLLKFNKLTQRLPNSIFTEFGFDPNKPIREQEPNPLPDRKALDDIVFDTLGLTKEERKEVYYAVAEFVKNRLEKARSV